MANETGGFGLRSVYTLGSSPATQGLSEYPIKSNPGKGMFQNNPASKQGAGDTGYLQDAANATMDDGIVGGYQWANNTANILPMLGVFNGAFYISNSTSKPTWANSVAASTVFATDYNTGSSDGVGFVNDNPNQEYVVKADAAAAISIMVPDLTYNIEDGATAGTTHEGTSQSKLDIGSSAAAGAGQAAFMIVRVANDPLNSDNSVLNSNLIVRFAPGSIMSKNY
tara:strand:+ start:551 stop:1225 length:675 start_codon:yes stop_codon:yes gene_type:complete